MCTKSNYIVKTPSPDRVFTLLEVKTYTKAIAEITLEDALIYELIDAARDWAEMYTNRALLKQTIVMATDFFPTKCNAKPYASIELFRSPVRSITQIRYTKKDGEAEILLPAEFRVSIINEPALVFPKETWPSDADMFPGAVEVEYEAGYTTPSDIPAIIRRGMLIFIADNYEYRENDVQMKTTKAENYLRHYRVEKF